MSSGVRDTFIVNLMNREEIRNLDLDKRIKIIKRILNDLKDILSPLEFKEEEFEYSFPFLKEPNNNTEQFNEEKISFAVERLSKDSDFFDSLGKEEEKEECEEDSFEKGAYGRSPLHEAINMRNLDIVRRFIQEGKYLNSRDNNNNTPYEMAYQIGYDEALEIFKKANVA